MRNRLHVEGQVQGRTGSDAQPHHSIGVGVGVGVGTGIPPGVGGGGAKTSNFDLNASSPNLNLGAAAAALSANTLQQHVNGGGVGGQHTLPKVSSSRGKAASIPTINNGFNSSTLPITLARRYPAMQMVAAAPPEL